MNKQQLQDAIRTLTSENEALLAKAHEFTAEDAAKVSGNNAALKSHAEALQQIAAAQQSAVELEELKKMLAAPAGAPPHPSPGKHNEVLGLEKAGYADIYRDANGFNVKQVGPGHLGQKTYETLASDEYRTTYRDFLRKGFINLTNQQQKVLQEGIDDQGGYMAPTQMIDRIIMREPTPTRVAGLVSSLNTTRDSISVPKVIYTTDDLYTTGIRVTWTGEVPTSSTQHRVTEPVFGYVRVPVYTAMLSIPITNDLLEDSSVDLESWLVQKFSETIDLLMDNMILNGTGSGQPTGILANPGGTDQPSVIVSGDASALTFDGLLNTAWSVPEQYEDNLRWVYNKTSTGLALAKLKDGDGRPLWGAGPQDTGMAVHDVGPKPLFGYPSVFSGFMPNVAANAFPMIFGDMRGYQLVRRVGFSIQPLRELYAETNQMVLLGRLRFGGQTLEGHRLRIHKVAAS